VQAKPAPAQLAQLESMNESDKLYAASSSIVKDRLGAENVDNIRLLENLNKDAIVVVSEVRIKSKMC